MNPFVTTVKLCNTTSMKSEDMKKAPKLFCENVSVGFSAEYFVVGLSSGSQGTLYTFTPQHAKRLQQYLAHQISEFEKQQGVIDATWNPNVVSPVQRMNPPTSLS